jgi:hypothetical protein
MHPDTDVLCCAYGVDDGPVELWRPGDPVPEPWIKASCDPDWLAVAFNDSFERLIEANIMGPRYGWPEIPVARQPLSDGQFAFVRLAGKIGNCSACAKPAPSEGQGRQQEHAGPLAPEEAPRRRAGVIGSMTRRAWSGSIPTANRTWRPSAPSSSESD